MGETVGPVNLLFWLVAVTGCIIVAWWLAVRPGASLRTIATPASALIIIMAVLLCLLALTGADAEDLGNTLRAALSG